MRWVNAKTDRCMRGSDIWHMLQIHIIGDGSDSAYPSHDLYAVTVQDASPGAAHNPTFAIPTESLLMLITILLVVLLLALVGGLPHWGYSRSWGYGPSGGLGLVVVILIVLLLMGRI